MDNFSVFPDKKITPSGIVSRTFLDLGITGFAESCLYVHRLPYGYNSNRDDPMILFKENMGSCTTKHAVIASLAEELGLPIGKAIGIYGMTEALVSGTDGILSRYNLPYLPMVHCFLVYEDYRVDLTEGNRNGKNRPIEHFLHTQNVEPNISAKTEYLLFRKVLSDKILKRAEMQRTELKQLLKAREEGLVLLKAKVSRD